MPGKHKRSRPIGGSYASLAVCTSLDAHGIALLSEEANGGESHNKTMQPRNHDGLTHPLEDVKRQAVEGLAGLLFPNVPSERKLATKGSNLIQ